MGPLRILAAAIVAFMFSAGIALATMPLITDDTGTQGTGKFQAEMGYEHQQLEGGGISQQLNSLTTILTGGATKNVDIVVTIPVLALTTEDSGAKTSASGLGDVSLEVKWRFFESGGLSFALKPGVFFPSGDDAKGLGNGDFAPRLMFVATKELDPLTFHANIGYTRNNNKIDQNCDIWHASLAAVYKVSDRVSLLTNAGAEGCHDKRSDTPEHLVLGGLVFSVVENFDLDIGAKGWLSDALSGWSLLAGSTFRF